MKGRVAIVGSSVPRLPEIMKLAMIDSSIRLLAFSNQLSTASVALMAEG